MKRHGDSDRRRARPLLGRTRRARSRSLRTRAGSRAHRARARSGRRAFHARVRPCVLHGGWGSFGSRRTIEMRTARRHRLARNSRDIAASRTNRVPRLRIQVIGGAAESGNTVDGALHSLHEVFGRRIGTPFGAFARAPVSFSARSGRAYLIAPSEATKARVVSALNRATKFATRIAFPNIAQRRCGGRRLRRACAPSFATIAKKAISSRIFGVSTAIVYEKKASPRPIHSPLERHWRAREKVAPRTMAFSSRSSSPVETAFRRHRTATSAPKLRVAASIGDQTDEGLATASDRCVARRRNASSTLIGRRAGCRPRKRRADPTWPRLPWCLATRRNCWCVRPRTADCRPAWLRCARWW